MYKTKSWEKCIAQRTQCHGLQLCAGGERDGTIGAIEMDWLGVCVTACAGRGRVVIGDGKDGTTRK